MHHSVEHPRQILANDTYRKELRTGEHSDDRSEKGKSGNDSTCFEVADENVSQYTHSYEREGKTDKASQPEGLSTESCQHVDRVTGQLTESVVRMSDDSFVVVRH